ncbi:hypothetical protein KC19_2G137900 [Ceratodon purpureus]|uniref:MADS-box domain-containing protein n=1 Tax=Ceratodon purpureus TaxID=3225 RepID=A0A8T0IWI9_CERPU|nr:hypothetical protein KC19_2G137900 [Ceratodon purpureus]
MKKINIVPAKSMAKRMLFFKNRFKTVLKKAQEFADLCGVDVGVLIISPDNENIYNFSTIPFERIYEKYRNIQNRLRNENENLGGLEAVSTHSEVMDNEFESPGNEFEAMIDELCQSEDVFDMDYQAFEDQPLPQPEEGQLLLQLLPQLEEEQPSLQPEEEQQLPQLEEQQLPQLEEQSFFQLEEEQPLPQLEEEPPLSDLELDQMVTGFFNFSECEPLDADILESPTNSSHEDHTSA